MKIGEEKELIKLSKKELVRIILEYEKTMFEFMRTSLNKEVTQYISEEILKIPLLTEKIEPLNITLSL